MAYEGIPTTNRSVTVELPRPRESVTFDVHPNDVHPSEAEWKAGPGSVIYPQELLGGRYEREFMRLKDKVALKDITDDDLKRVLAYFIDLMIVTAENEANYYDGMVAEIIQEHSWQLTEFFLQVGATNPELAKQRRQAQAERVALANRQMDEQTAPR